MSSTHDDPNKPRFEFVPLPEPSPPTPRMRAMAAFEGWLVVNVGSIEADQAWLLVNDIVKAERYACAHVAEAVALKACIDAKEVCVEIANLIRSRG